MSVPVAQVTTARMTVVQQQDGQWRSSYDEVLPVNATVTVGREGDARIGLDPVDTSVSRRALTVTVREDGWDLVVTNRNGAALHRWAQPALAAVPMDTVRWPLVGVRLFGADAVTYWVLLRNDRLARQSQTERQESEYTGAKRTARPLTAAQLEAVRAIFAENLAWPPLVNARPRALKQVARQLGCSESAVQERLNEVRRKAVTLGLAREVSLTDPEYVYVLASAGYLHP
jgi:hypothetical protein